jgi:hypothetical protein
VRAHRRGSSYGLGSARSHRRGHVGKKVGRPTAHRWHDGREALRGRAHMEVIRGACAIEHGGRSSSCEHIEMEVG